MINKQRFIYSYKLQILPGKTGKLMLPIGASIIGAAKVGEYFEFYLSTRVTLNYDEVEFGFSEVSCEVPFEDATFICRVVDEGKSKFVFMRSNETLHITPGF